MKRGKSCQLRIDFHPQLYKNVMLHRRSNGYIKKSVLSFISNLYNEGYRHFLIHINQSTDIWIAEILFFMSFSDRYTGVSYSIGFWLDDEDPYYWLDEMDFLTECILKHAKRVFWRSSKWYDSNYQVKWGYIGLK